MQRSESILKLAPALLKVQREMGDAKKEAANPFFRSTYADLNAIREVAIPVLNENGITCLQPTVEVNCKNFVETILIHESGEWLSSLTEIKNTDGKAQSEGSGISYARRYGLQSLLNIGAVDDDAETAMGRSKTPQAASKHSPQEQVGNVTKKGPGRPAKAPTPQVYTKTAEFTLPKEQVTKLPTKAANGFSGNSTHGNVISNEDEW